MEVLADVVCDAAELEGGESTGAGVGVGGWGVGVFGDEVGRDGGGDGFAVGAAAGVVVLGFGQECANGLGEVGVLNGELEGELDGWAGDEFAGGLLKEFGVDLEEDEIAGLGGAEGEACAGGYEGYGADGEVVFFPVLAIEFPELGLAGG